MKVNSLFEKLLLVSIVVFILASCDAFEPPLWEISKRLLNSNEQVKNPHPKLSEVEFFQKAGSFYLEGLFHRGLHRVFIHFWHKFMVVCKIL